MIDLIHWWAMLGAVQGQREAVQYLSKVIDRSLSTPLLLVGTEGTGRRFSVVETAVEIFREGDPEKCSQCYKLKRGIHPDFHVIRPEDNKDIKVSAIRDLIGHTGFHPSQAPLKFLVIDGADRMTSAAANALLKTLEESPKSVRFFLLAEDASLVIPTIRSRCAMVRYQPLPEDFILQSLANHTEDVTKALVCCRLAEGSVGRALKFLGSGRLVLRDQMISLLKIGLTRDLARLFSTVDSIGADLGTGLHFCEHILHDLVMLPCLPSRITNLDVASDLDVLRSNLGVKRIAELRLGLTTLRHSLHGSITLPFHVKSWLTSVFI
jgi:DNA polymerase-3 subunit delta'